MTLEATSGVCGVGTEAGCDEVDAECDTDDGGGCGGSVAVVVIGSAFTKGVELMSGRVS